MALKEVGGVLISDGDHETKRTDVEKELKAGLNVTEFSSSRSAAPARRVTASTSTATARCRVTKRRPAIA